MERLNIIRGSGVHAWAEERPYASRLLECCEVEALLAPRDDRGVLEAYEWAAGAGVGLVPVGGGLHGTRAAGDGPIAFLDMRSIRADIDISLRSNVARVAAGTRWREIERAASEDGLTVAHLVDFEPNATVGGTLASPSILPPLWRSYAARAACVSLSAIGASHGRYANIDAPRTASGPDLRAIYFGSAGAVGVITEAIIALEPAGDTLLAEGPPGVSAWRALSDCIRRHPGLVAATRGTDERPLRARVRLLTSEADAALRELRSSGFVVYEGAPAPAPTTGSAVVTLPWQLLVDAFRSRRSSKFDLSIIAGGDTHVAVQAALTERGRRQDLEGWRDRLLSIAPGLVRAQWRHLLAGPTETPWALRAAESTGIFATVGAAP